ncbi:erythromycin esterase family protein [Aureispira sp. CCB-E]|uniref:erythromycin esterase family protein n=1 Tax=Aureispira sp. CCB-E TaxID=3051121 RepID=UPI0028690DC6|nr:erythromycin esterase family protein [Aureispira sp. CCB-E]WMX13342.1 erythromycin esterase family protein [Aureispira sp. CCB-E]
MHLLKVVFIFPLLFSILTGCTNTQSSPQQTDLKNVLSGKELFIEWGQKNLISFENEAKLLSDSLLEKIAADIANAKVVLLSEGFHNCEEMLRLQQQLIPYLIEHKGFNTVITESGLPESKYMNDYIHGKDSISNLWERSVGSMYTQWKTGRKTIESLRTYNQQHANQVDYIGADIGGFYNNWRFPFEQIFSYIDSVDAPLSKQLRRDMAPYFKVMTKWAAYHYMIKLTDKQKNNLMVILEDLIDSFQSNKATYISRSSLKDYQWILQCIRSMRMAENYYRNYQDATDTVNSHSKYAGLNGREIAMAKNIQWALSYKKEAKIIVVNHVVHTKTASQYQGEMYGNFTPMGQLLQQQLKDSLYVIGMVYGKGLFWNKWQVPDKRFVDTIPAPPIESMEHVMKAIATKNYYLNFKEVPSSTYSWFNANTIIKENDYEITIRPSEWDACFYLHEVHPAKPVE